MTQKLSDSLHSISQLLTAVRAPIPDTGDGSNLNPTPVEKSLLAHIGEDLATVIQHLDIHDIATLIKVWDKKQTGEPTNDRTYLMEGLITVLKTTCPVL